MLRSAKVNPLPEFMLDQKTGEGMCHYVAPVTEEQVLSEAKKTGFKVAVKS